MKNTKGRMVELLISLSAILIGVYDIYFRGVLLTEIVKWTAIGLVLNIIGIALIVFIKERIGEGETDSSSKVDWTEITKRLSEVKRWRRLIIATVIIEELIFRGPIYIAMLFLELPAQTWTFIIIIDAVIFALAHFQQDSSLLGFSSRSLTGLILSGLVIKSNSLIPSFCLHILWSGSLLGIMMLESKTPE